MNQMRPKFKEVNDQTTIRHYESKHNIKTADAIKIYFGMHVKPPSVSRKLTDNQTIYTELKTY